MAQIKQIANETFNQVATKGYVNGHYGYLTSYYLNFEENKFSYSIDQQTFNKQESLMDKVIIQYVNSLLKMEVPVVFYEIQQVPGSTYISGLGEDHVTETGVDVHTTYGVPYIKGSALKGLLFSWMSQVDSPDLTQEMIEKIFGYESEDDSKNSQMGEVVFHDVFFNNFSLQKDIMTPHFQNYYEGRDLSEQNSPKPISFITNKFAEPGLGVLSLTERSYLTQEDLDILVNWLNNALQEFGIGAKTAIGHGRFTAQKSKDESIARLLKERTSDEEFFKKEIETKRAEIAQEQARKKIEDMSEEEREEYEALLQNEQAPSNQHIEDTVVKSMEFIELSAKYPRLSKALYEYYDERGWLKKPSKKMEPRVKRLKEIYKDHHGDA